MERLYHNQLIQRSAFHLSSKKGHLPPISAEGENEIAFYFAGIESNLPDDSS